MVPLLTIITPTYNRKSIIPKLYDSLCSQSNQNFIWLVIDDGSSDNTKDFINNIIDLAPFEVIYIYKQNGGKHTALNMGIPMITTELTIIVDSDDVLTSDAVESIYNEWNTVRDDVSVCGMIFLRGFSIDTYIGTDFGKLTGIVNYNDIMWNDNIKGDKSEVFRTDILLQFPFPEFDNERFLGERISLVKIASKHRIHAVNKIIYITEYLDGGLTKSGKKLRIKSPKGGMANSKQDIKLSRSFKQKVKYAWLYICYGFFAKKTVRYMLRDSENSILVFINLPFGYLLYRFWLNKYLKQEGF